jgi:hypothetical protein
MPPIKASLTKCFGFVLGALVLAGCSAPATSSDSDSASTGESAGKLLAGNKLSETQVASLLSAAGFTSTEIPAMVCTAKYESADYDRASNQNANGTVDYGLFQINSVHVGKGGCTALASSLYDTTVNTSCARQIYNEQGNNAWYGYQKHKAECDSYVIAGSGTSSGSSGSTGSGSSSSGSTGSGSSGSGSTGSSGGSSGSSGSGTSGSGDDGSSGSCWSATLDQEMPEYSCVNSSIDPGEYQCIGGSWVGGVEDGSGAGGACNGEY